MAVLRAEIDHLGAPIGAREVLAAVRYRPAAECDDPAETRLYRGLKRPYRATALPADRLNGTDFTDCPYAALS
jgi:hypothetical protein